MTITFDEIMELPSPEAKQVFENIAQDERQAFVDSLQEGEHFLLMAHAYPNGFPDWFFGSDEPVEDDVVAFAPSISDGLVEMLKVAAKPPTSDRIEFLPPEPGV